MTEQNNSEFYQRDRSSEIDRTVEKFRSDVLNSVCASLERFSSEVRRIEENPTTLPLRTDNNDRRRSSEFPTKIFEARPSILTVLLEYPHIRSIRQIFISILIILVLQVGLTDIFERGSIDFRLDIILWNFSNLSSCVVHWFFLFFSTSVIVYGSFYGWSKCRLSLMSKNHQEKRFFTLINFDRCCLICYCLYIVLFLYIPVHKIIEENYPIVTRIIILIEQVRFLMKSHAFVRENIPKTIRYGQYKSQTPITDEETRRKLAIPAEPCPHPLKYLYFIFAPTMIYRDDYPRNSAIRWNYVFTQLAQFAASSLFSYYVFDRFCLPIFSHFKSEHFTLKTFVLSILNSTLPGALVLFCVFYGFLHCWLNAFAEMLRFADREFYGDWWTATSWRSYYRRWNIVRLIQQNYVIHDWLHIYIFRDISKLLGVKYQSVSLFTVIFLSAVVHEYIFSIAFGYFYPILFVQFALLGCISMVILPQTTRNNVYNVFIWTSLFIGLGMQMCLYSMEWYARQICPRTLDVPWDYLVPRSFYCRDVNDTLNLV